MNVGYRTLISELFKKILTNIVSGAVYFEKPSTFACKTGGICIFLFRKQITRDEVFLQGVDLVVHGILSVNKNFSTKKVIFTRVWG